jgi:hypothetical protein
LNVVILEALQGAKYFALCSSEQALGMDEVQRFAPLALQEVAGTPGIAGHDPKTFSIINQISVCKTLLY